MVRTTNEPADPPSVPLAVWAGFFVMCVGMFMAILDVQIVATSLPTIQVALDIAQDRMSWVQTAYLIAEVVAIPLTGLFTRVLGMRWLFVSAISTFALASAGCAASPSFASLISWRVLQGFAGGTLIPAVFSAVFLMFPPRLQGIATTLAGVLAVLAPTAGPIVGGWITESYSWHWLFLVNLAPGVASALIALPLLPRERPNWAALRALDTPALALMALGLATLEIGLKEAPEQGWSSGIVLGLIALAALLCGLFVRRSWGAPHPVVEIATLRQPRFAVGCALSFVCGVGLFGSTYLMPVFLGFVRGHGPFEIGTVMLVTGVAQLATAPIAVALERRVDARLLTTAGFALFGLGAYLSARQTVSTDFDAMLWPQVVRGSAIMLCLLPPTRLALGHLPPESVGDASGLFNLMRNLGGAIGLALIDTVVFGRAPVHAHALMAGLMAGDEDAATRIGIPLAMFKEQSRQALDQATQTLLTSLVERAALAEAINEAWLLVAVLTVAALLLVPFAGTLGGSPRGAELA